MVLTGSLASMGRPLPNIVHFVACFADGAYSNTVLSLSVAPRIEVVARGGPIREANQDGEVARKVRIDPSRSESIEPPTREFSVNRFQDTT